MHKILKNTAILTAITLVLGVLLGTVYEVTKGPIEELAQERLYEVYHVVFEDAASFEESNGFDAAEATALAAKAGFAGDEIVGAAAAKDEAGAGLGNVVTVISHEGVVGDIKLTVGVRTDGTVNAVEILEISETPGLGMKATEPEFKDQFKGKKVAAFVCTKTGEEGDEMIDAISGSTLTTNAVINAVNSAIVYSQNVTGGGVNE